MSKEQKLEAMIDRELKGLPEISAPPTLIGRVAAVLEDRGYVPWYRKSWLFWPVPVRAASLALLLAVFAGLCFAGWHFSHVATMAASADKITQSFSGATSLWEAALTVLGALNLVVKQAGTGLIVGVLIGMGLIYSMMVGLGTCYFRLAIARR